MGQHGDDGVTGTGEQHVAALVIGAGVSGLRVARGLQDLGVSVRVLEARDRVGGRLHTRRLDDGRVCVDMGATWFWPGELRVAELVEHFSIETHPQHIAGDALYHGPEGPRRLDGNPLDVPAMRFSGGAQVLAEALASSLAAGVIRRDAVVTAVVGSGPFRVHVNDQVLHARHVVVAVPPALAAASIRFEPALPQRLAAVTAVTPVWMGSTAKVVAVYDSPFWRTSGLAGSAVSHIGPLREIHDMSGPEGQPAALFGFAAVDGPGGPLSEATVTAQLTELFGPEAAAPCAVLIADWRSEQQTSPPGVEDLDAYQAFGHAEYRPAPGRFLYWSSTETADVAAGHIEGALQAAERTVQAIARHEAPASLGPTTVEGEPA